LELRGYHYHVRIVSRFCRAILFGSAVLLSLHGASAADGKHRVVVVVWDGMRPDFVSEKNTPTLWKFSQEGVVFRNHHAVYLSATHVNGTAIETGVYPNHNGLIANYDYRPQIDDKKFVSTEQADVIRKGDEISHGKYLTAPTIAELVRAAGGRTAVAAAKTVGFLLDRQIDAGAGAKGVTLSAGETLPREALKPIVSSLGFFPGFPMYRHAERDVWTTRALTESLWKTGLPDFSILWLGEPDLSEHETLPGTPAALTAIKSSDDNLAAVLATLDRKGARADTDVFVVSDHGFSSIERAVDVRKFLAAAGLNAIVDFREEQPKRGDIILVGNGGSVLFYVVGHDAAMTERLVKALQQSDFAGVIFTKEALPGTFSFSKAQIESPHGPDVAMAFRWNDRKNEFGAAGMLNGDWNRQNNKGTHASLSRFDMHNILFAAGPDFQRGQVDERPSGNVDLAPTIVRILGIKSPSMDGRVLSEALSEAMTSASLPEPKAGAEEVQTLKADHDFPNGAWRQYLRVSRVGSTTYIDEGNGEFVPKKE
jgi:predicted AlkP superfamily pyrophosphatase or phosphodiesterase